MPPHGRSAIAWQHADRRCNTTSKMFCRAFLQRSGSLVATMTSSANEVAIASSIGAANLQPLCLEK